jgi:hypothetical protein
MKLTSAMRAKIPTSQFGQPKVRKYPMNDREHAGLAKSYAKRQYARGKLSLSQLGQIRTKANRVLGT